MPEHKDITGVNVHVPFSFEYADATARNAATGFDPGDVGKFAHQIDDDSFWMLKDDLPVTWKPVGSPTGFHTDGVFEFENIPEETTPVSGDKFLIEKGDYGGKAWVDFDNLPGGGGGGVASWTKIIDESGASFTNFVSTAGTWASDGAKITQTDTSAAAHRARYDTKIPTHALMVKAEIQVRSSGAERQTGFLLGYDGTNAGSISVKIKEEDIVTVEREGIAAEANFSATIDLNTWYTLKVILFGDAVSIYLDDVFIGSARSLGSGMSTSFFGLVSYQAESWFRNIGVWTLDLPAI